jgi:hypothetical protein
MARQLIDSRVKVTIDGFDFYTIPNTFSMQLGLPDFQTRIAHSGPRIKRVPVYNLEEVKGMMTFQTLNDPDIVAQYVTLKESARAGNLTVTAVWEDPKGNVVAVLPRATLLADLTIEASNDGALEFSLEGDPINLKT